MLRKLSFTVVWFFAFMLGACLLLGIGGVIFGKSGADSHNWGYDYGRYMVIGSLILSSTLCFLRILPGTRLKK